MDVLALLVLTWASTMVSSNLIPANHNFSIALYQKLSTKSGNLLLSPLSAQMILALSETGARNETSEEIRAVLNLPSDQNDIKTLFDDIFLDLDARHDFTLQPTNKVFVQQDYSIRHNFTEVAERIFRAQSISVDFGKNETASLINKYVEEETNGRISDLVSPGLLGNDTKLVLINALQFRANWSHPFQFYATYEENFWYTPNASVMVQTMHVSGEIFLCYDKPDFAKFVVLPIVGDNAFMTVVVPEEPHGLEFLEKHMDKVLEEPESTTKELLNIELPKFKIHGKIDLKAILQNMGVVKAFQNAEADFTGIAGEKGELFISDVVQKTYIDVNEDGMDAAAASFVVKIVDKSADDSKDLRINRPFIFFVKVNGLVVFLGRVLLPVY